MKKPENELSIYNIQAPQTLGFVTFDIAQQAIRSTLDQLQGKVSGNTVTEIQTELLNALKETFTQREQSTLAPQTVKNYSFEQSLSNFVMVDGRNLRTEVKKMVHDVNGELISGQNKVSTKALLQELTKGYAKVFRAFEIQLIEKADSTPGIINLQERDSINALFKKTLIDTAIQTYREFSKTLKGDNIFNPSHPTNPLYHEAKEMFEQKKVTNTSAAASNFLNDNYFSMIGKAIGKYYGKLAEEFLNTDAKPLSYIEHKNLLNNFFEPHIKEALAMRDDDPEKNIRVKLLLEAQKEASRLIEIHYNNQHDLKAPSTPQTQKSTIKLESMSSEPSSKRSSFRFKSPSSASSSKRGSMNFSSEKQKGLIPDAFKIDPKKLEAIKAERDQVKKEVTTFKK